MIGLVRIFSGIGVYDIVCDEFLIFVFLCCYVVVVIFESSYYYYVRFMMLFVL